MYKVSAGSLFPVRSSENVGPQGQCVGTGERVVSEEDVSGLLVYEE